MILKRIGQRSLRLLLAVGIIAGVSATCVTSTGCSKRSHKVHMSGKRSNPSKKSGKTSTHKSHYHGKESRKSRP